MTKVIIENASKVLIDLILSHLYNQSKIDSFGVNFHKNLPTKVIIKKLKIKKR